MFSSFAERSQEKELMDLGADHYSLDEYRQCLKKLFKINQLLGFFKSTVHILKKLPVNASLLDVGCGGGLFILNLSRFFPQMKMHGIDVSPEAIMEAQKKNAGMNVTFELQKKPELNMSKNSVDIILTTLVCHHMSDDELVEFLRQAYLVANKAIIIHDLHRHRIAYWLYAVISPILFRNRLIRHDGLISIRRGFTRAEWKLFLHKAGIQHYQLKWHFPFRWKLIVWK